MKGRERARTRNQTFPPCSAPMAMQKCCLAGEGLVQTYPTLSFLLFFWVSPARAQRTQTSVPSPARPLSSHTAYSSGASSPLPHLQCGLVSSILKMRLFPLLPLCIPGTKLYSGEDKPPLSTGQEILHLVSCRHAVFAAATCLSVPVSACAFVPFSARSF